MVGQKTRGGDYLEIEQRKIELEEQLLDLQERRINIEQKRIELELRKIKLLSRKAKKKSRTRDQPARDESPDGAQEERGSGGNLDSEDDDYEATIRGTAATSGDDDDDYYDEDEDNEEVDAPIVKELKEKKSSIRRSFKRSNSSSSGLNPGSEHSPTTATTTTNSSRHKSRSIRGSSGRPTHKLSDAELAPLPRMGRTRTSGSGLRKSTSCSTSSDDAGEDKDGPPPLPPIPPIIKAGKTEGLKAGHRRMNRRGTAPTSTTFDNMPQPDDKRDTLTKHNSMRNFEPAGSRKASVPAASMLTSAARLSMNESETSMDALSVKTEKRSNKTAAEQQAPPPGAIVTPSLAKNPARDLWK